MPRSVAEIQADIDRVKAQIAYNQKYSQGFAQPSTKVGWNSYIINNDRGLLDAYQARENAWKRQMANADMQREIAAINKSESENDKRILKNKEVNKDMLAAELAQAEYDDAVNKVDLDKPETILAARKAGIKLNYANRSLPYYADDPQSFTVATEFTEDAEPVKINKAVNTAIQTLDPIVASPTKLWTKEQKAAYDEAFEVIKKYRPDLIPKYQIEAAKKGKTVDETEAAYQAELKAAGDNYAKIQKVKKKYGRK